ncbi:MAG: HAD-IIIA family hydrolase [Selenomonadaceae bacterium]|nr:HAD-IIIA family hydrolase [Selenomonadaceae bacterium]
MDLKDRAKKIKVIAFDVDGVLTDGGIYTGADGEIFKPFHCRDGLGISLARNAGLKLAIITGRKSPQVAYRAKELKFDALWQGVMDKREAYKELKEKFSATDEEICYVGDDLIDLPILTQVGLATAVADAMPEVIERVHYVAKFSGGHGAARDVIECILKAQGKWEGIIEGYLAKVSPKQEKINQ